MDNRLKDYLETLEIAWKSYQERVERLDKLESILGLSREGKVRWGSENQFEIQDEQELLSLLDINTDRLEEAEESLRQYILVKSIEFME